MSQQPDKLFRDKLQQFEQAPPANAWQRVQSNVASKKRQRWIVRAAAAVLLLATGTLLIYLPQGSRETPIAINDPLVNQEPMPQPEKNAGTDNPELPKPDTTVSSPETRKRPTRQEPNNPMQKVEKTVAPPVAEQVPATIKDEETTPGINVMPDLTEVPVASVDPPVVNNGTNTDIALENSTGQSQRGVTIVFTAEEVNSKYLSKSLGDEATSDDEASSGLKKLLDKAYDLKNNQDLIGSLRQKKNEILAMNFKNEKESTRND